MTFSLVPITASFWVFLESKLFILAVRRDNVTLHRNAIHENAGDTDPRECIAFAAAHGSLRDERGSSTTENRKRCHGTSDAAF